MPHTTLISTETLAAELENPAWVIVDCSYDLSQPDLARQNYRQAHIPGAVYAHLGEDLASHPAPHTGRHPLPDRSAFLNKLGAWGIRPDTQVVVYDTLGGSYAARLWCMLRMLNHLAVAVLDGGLQKWQAEQRPLRQGDEHNSPVEYILPDASQKEVFVDTPRVDNARQNQDFLVLDARAAERYRGEVEPYDTVAGHIPGAVSRPYSENLTPEGVFKSPDQLRAEFQALLQGRPSENTIHYCGSGVTSCHHLLAMEVAGLAGSKVYAGSWSEWIRDETRPIGKA